MLPKWSDQKRLAMLMLPFSLSSLFQTEVAWNNQGVRAYEAGDYVEAEKRFTQAAGECQEKEGSYCDQVYYNLGNTFYRLGEVAADETTRRQLWEKAVAYYEKSRTLQAGDQQTVENLEFVKRQLEALKQAQSEEDNRDEGEVEQEGRRAESDEGEGEEGGESDAQTGEGGQSQVNEGKVSGEDEAIGRVEEGKRLSEEMNQQLEQYMEEQERAMRQFAESFRRGSQHKRESSDPLTQFFTDPFLEQFFGESFLFERWSSESDQRAEPDW